MTTGDPVMGTPAKPPFSDPGAPNLIPEETQASFTGRKWECPNPSDEPMSTPDPVMDTPAKLSFSDLGALNPIPEEAQASFTGREKSALIPALGP